MHAHGSTRVDKLDIAVDAVTELKYGELHLVDGTRIPVVNQDELWADLMLGLDEES